MSIITVERKILEKNDAAAAELRKRFFQEKQFVMNILSSPGAGKTSLIEKTAAYSKDIFSISVIVGDVQTDNDARRIGKLDIPVVQIVTNGGCHLDALLVREAYEKLEPVKTDILIIENVGNLVCPAGFDLGENVKIVVASTTEGDDKPLKYPVVFRNSSVMVINKIDLLPYVNCSLHALRKNALSINPDLKIFEVSCITGYGIDEWCGWLGSIINKNYQ